MSLPLNEQVVIVSGAGRGFGAAIAAAFAREGAKVAINYRNSRGPAEDLAVRLGDDTRAFQADIRSLDETKRLVDEVTAHFGAPTTVVHNALSDFSFNGDARPKLDELNWSDISAQLDTAVQGALNLIQAARPSMAEARFGRVVTIGTNLFQNPVVPYHD
ncbi:NAD(P)-dependent dehydrogenase (short-subunit alcohol dehydrogenase family) [Rhizobium sp. BK313]|nr:NAD(P)-dependent dehydrogenase (short-subunit alcohol dehydrogenase family) [Rhizobium sp. BK313]